MSFYEWWAESSNPGPVGTVEFGGEEHERCRWKPLVWARFLFVAIGLPILWGVIVSMVPLPWYQATALVVGISLIYIALSYLIEVKPDMSNVGWGGGLVDDPFRYSDDINRQLMSVQCLLGPGRFVVESIVDWMELVAVYHESPDEAKQQDEHIGQNWSDPYQNAGRHEQIADHATEASEGRSWTDISKPEVPEKEDNWYATRQ